MTKSKWTRREMLKTGLAISASAATGKGARPLTGLVDSLASTDPTLEKLSSSRPQGPELHASSPRERFLLDFGWHFHLGHASDPSRDFGFGAIEEELTFAKSGGMPKVTRLNFDDSGWRAIDLPHDWAVELPFKNVPESPDHGSKPLGRNYPETSIGWYRRVFELPESDASKRITVEFDGAFRNAMVILNGFYIGENFSGYAPFIFDLTDFVNFGGKNVLTVRVDATLGEGWFYEGAGIYRHVWLTKTAPIHVAHWGPFVESRVQGTDAELLIKTEVENDGEEERLCTAICRVFDTQQKKVGTVQSKQQKLSPGGDFTFDSRMPLKGAKLWSLEEPHLYQLITEVRVDGAAVDQTETTFGIRTIRFDADEGFFLNGKAVKIMGTCNHQDHAGVGLALPDRLQYYRIERLKEMGSNAYRASPNPPTAELLEACDRLGMLVMDETRMMSSNPEGLSELERLIRRDRNHPSVIIWSLGNEEWFAQGTSRGARIVSSMKRLVRKLDPTRPVTLAMNGELGKGASQMVDVQGFNYAGAGENGSLNTAQNLDDFHARFPKQPTIGTETASTYSTRGIYVSDEKKGFASAYDVNFPSYGLSSESWWKIYDERRFLSGGFVWAGFDYRGEPFPYRWPCISSQYGVIDTCGFPKDNYFYYQAWWGVKPVLHLFPHWNWEGKEGQDVAVWCHSNLDSVELFLNGASLGEKRVSRNSHIEWNVKYVPGVLEARGSKNGEVLLTEKRETTGAPTKLVLRPDRVQIPADGEDLSVVPVEVVDDRGRLVPTACNEIGFRVEGPGRLIGLGNGDPSSHESDKPSSFTEARRSAFNGLCMALVQALKQPGSIRVEASSAGLDGSAVVITANQAKLRPAL
jgi:beta-galactosidase